MVLFHSLLNIATLALLLLFAFQYQVVRNSEVADARYTLAYYLFAGGDRSGVFLDRRIETIDEFVNSLERTVRAYYAVPTRSRGLFMHYTSWNASHRLDDAAVAPPELFVQYHEGDSSSPAFANILTGTYPLTLDDPIGPFANASALLRNYSESCVPEEDSVAGGTFIPCRVSAIGNLLDRLVQLRLTFSLFSRGRRWTGNGAMAVVSSTWDVAVEFGFEGHKAVVTMATQLSSVSRRQRERGPVLVCWLLVLAALTDLYVRLGTELKDAAATRGKHPLLRKPPSTSLSAGSTTSRLWLDRPGVKENGWKWLGYLSNGAVLAFAATALVAQHQGQTGDSLEEAVTLLLAFAALFSSFRVVVLLKLFPSWYVLIDGLATALEQLFVLAVGVLPVLIGFAVCGTAVFGGFSNSAYFRSIPAAVVTMLCTMFGDNLIDTFLLMDQSPYHLQIFFARLFFITFMALFVCNILNIAHSIIQDSYSQAQKSYASMLAAEEAARLTPPSRSASAPHYNDDDNGSETEKSSTASDRDNDDDVGDGSSEGEGVCACSAAATSATVSMSSHDNEECLKCGLLKPPPPPQLRRRLRWRGRLQASEVERMLRRLNKISL